MTKEDILAGYESVRVKTDDDHYEDMWPEGCVMQAMDQYAKAILDWVSKKAEVGDLVLATDGNFYIGSDNDGDYPLNVEEIINLYENNGRKTS